MSTPSGQDPYDPNAYPSGQPPQGRGGQDMYAPEENIPRQDSYDDTAQQSQYAPDPGAAGPGNQEGRYYQQTNGYQQGGGYQGAGYPPAAGYAAATAAPRTYLQGAPVGFVEAVRGAFSNIFTLHGRASRSAFWWFTLAAAIINAIAGVVSNQSRVAGIIIDIVVWLPVAIAGITVTVRRLHDSGKSGWWWWLWIVPVVGWIVLLIFYLLPGTPGLNRYNRAVG